MTTNAKDPGNKSGKGNQQTFKGKKGETVLEKKAKTRFVRMWRRKERKLSNTT